MIVFAADRRISRGTANAGTRPKIFRLPHHNAAIGYFGLAEIDTGTSVQPMAEWLQDLFPTFQVTDPLSVVADRIVRALNAAIPLEVRVSEAVGLHLAGFERGERAQFWYIRNLDDTGQSVRPDIEAREDYRRRDSHTLPHGAAAVYRNGDTRAHVAAWESIDASLGSLLGTPSFRALKSPDDYVDWVRFKMETFARFYERFATESIIGLPIDCFAFAERANDA